MNIVDDPLFKFLFTDKKDTDFKKSLEDLEDKFFLLRVSENGLGKWVEKTSNGLRIHSEEIIVNGERIIKIRFL